MLFMRNWEANQEVCAHCNHHMRQRPLKRFPHLFDEGKFELHALPRVIQNPLKFRDTMRYDARLKAAQAKAEGSGEALAVASGAMGGRMSVIAALRLRLHGRLDGHRRGRGLCDGGGDTCGWPRDGGSIVFSASGGARMQEGILSLMQLTRTTIAVRKVKAAGLPYIVVLTDPTTGGVSASFAMLGDVHVAEPDAIIGFAGPRVIQDTIRQELPAGFQRSEYLLEHGMIDAVVHRHKLRETLIGLVSVLMDPLASERSGVAIAARWWTSSIRSWSASSRLHPRSIDLGLERVERLFAAALGMPQLDSRRRCSRRHQRQRLPHRLSAGDGRGGRLPRARLHVAPSRTLQRARPRRRPSDRR